MQIHLFGRDECGKCTSTRNKLHHFVGKYANGKPVEITYFDMESVEGMAEGAFRDVHKIPTTIIEADGRKVARWEGVIPDSDELKALLRGPAVGTA